MGRRWIGLLVALPAMVFCLRFMVEAPAQTSSAATRTPAPSAVVPTIADHTTIPGLPGLGGPFTLTDQNGKTRTDQEFRGKLLLVSFGFTGCSSVCPLQMQKISEALAEIPPAVANQVVPLFISIDPEGDSPQEMRRFLAAYHPSIIGLTGSEEQIDNVVREYHVHVDVGTPAEQKAGDIDHSDLQYLMGRDGKFLTLLLPNVSAEDIAARLSKYVART